MIIAKDLVRVFKSGTGEITVLKHINFEVPSGQFVAITGRSGSGKSTLLYQLGLLDSPTSGQISIHGTNVMTMSSDERTDFRLHQLGYIFQDYALVPVLTALENVMVPIIMQGVSQSEAEKRGKHALEKLSLVDKFSSLPNQLSGGEQQRVSIARAIAHNPKIIFADEPTANLDSETSETVLKAFTEINKSGQTIVMVTHEHDYAKRADRVITLSDGKIIADILTKSKNTGKKNR